MLFLLLITSFISRPESAVRDQVDVIELNHVVDGECKPVFTQTIFWKWYFIEGHYRVVDWRMSDQGVRPIRRRDQGDIWVCRWIDKKTNCWREVRAPHYRETTTQHDPEVDDRQFLPANRRIGLSRRGD